MFIGPSLFPRPGFSFIRLNLFCNYFNGCIGSSVVNCISCLARLWLVHIMFLVEFFSLAEALQTSSRNLLKSAFLKGIGQFERKVYLRWNRTYVHQPYVDVKTLEELPYTFVMGCWNIDISTVGFFYFVAQGTCDGLTDGRQTRETDIINIIILTMKTRWHRLNIACHAVRI